MSQPDSASNPQSRIGSVLRGKYRLDGVIGVGGMAAVYKATHRNDAELAVKILHPELSRDSEVRARFVREGKAANAVKHPGVVMVLDDDVTEDGAAFLVMELLHGADVATLTDSGDRRIPTQAALSVGVQLLDVLAAAHARGIVHRDIKPANLFVENDGTVKVLDFGIARVKDAALSHAQSGTGTATGVLMGTPAYMAPEQAYGKTNEIDGRTDLWSAGATLFTILTGDFVHLGDNAAALTIHAATAHARPVRTLLPDLPEAIGNVIDRALEYERDARWENAAAMRDALEKASVETFGERPSKQHLATLVAAYEATNPGEPQRVVTTEPRVGFASAATVQVPSDKTSVRASAPPPEAATPQPSLRASGGVVAQTTSKPVAAPVEPPLSPRRDRTVATVAGVCLVVGVGAGFWAMAGGARGSASSSASSAPPATSVASAMPLPAVTAASVLSAGEAPSASASAPSSSAAIPTTAPKSKFSSRAGSAPAKTPATPTVAPTPVANCNPPTWTDDKGHVHLKPGCQ